MVNFCPSTFGQVEVDAVTWLSPLAVSLLADRNVLDETIRSCLVAMSCRGHFGSRTVSSTLRWEVRGLFRFVHTATWKKFKFPRREAGPPNRFDDMVDSDQ